MFDKDWESLERIIAELELNKKFLVDIAKSCSKLKDLLMKK